jgi:hypothetical protein
MNEEGEGTNKVKETKKTTCGGVIICEIIVLFLVIVQNKKTKQRNDLINGFLTVHHSIVLY